MSLLGVRLTVATSAFFHDHLNLDGSVPAFADDGLRCFSPCAVKDQLCSLQGEFRRCVCCA